jgi:hypothetical protein
MDNLHFCFCFFPSHFVFPSMWWRAFLFIFFSHPAQQTGSTDFCPTLPSFALFPLLWIPVHLLVDFHIEVASVAPGVCSRLPFCVQYIKHAEPIR